MSMYWDIDSYGSAYPPENAEEIIYTANEMIDAFMSKTPGANDCLGEWYSEQLWDYYCTHGDLPKDGDLSQSA